MMKPWRFKALYRGVPYRIEFDNATDRFVLWIDNVLSGSFYSRWEADRELRKRIDAVLGTEG